MKRTTNPVILLAVALLAVFYTSCSGGGSKLFGSLPSVYEEYEAEADAIEEKAKNIKTEADKQELIIESQKMQEKWTAKIEAAAKALDGKKIDITDGEIKVTAPVSLTYDSFSNTRNLTPKFTVNGAAVAAVDIELESVLSTWPVYIAGYDEADNELFRFRVGSIYPDPVDRMTITEGTPVEFGVLVFDDEAEDYSQVKTLKLVVQ